MRAVLVGCGAMSRAWLEAIAKIDGLSVVGLVDIDLSRAKARANEFGLADAALGTDVGEMLASVRPDVVFDVVVPEARRDLALAAFAAGAHLLTEKPLADSLANAATILAAAKAAGRIHAVVQNRRYHPAVRRIRRFLESGSLGDITGLHCDFFIGPHFGGFREAMDHVLLLDMAIHTFDVARYFAGRTPVGVYCHETNPAGSWYRHGAAAVAIFDFADGAVFTYRGSWCAEGLRTSWESKWRIVGTRGTLTWDGLDSIVAEVGTSEPEASPVLRKPRQVEVPALSETDRIGGHLGVISDFVRAVRSGGEPETWGADNFHSIAMVFAAIASAESRRHASIQAEPEAAFYGEDA